MKYQLLLKEHRSLVNQLINKEFNNYILGLFNESELIGFVAFKIDEIEYIYIKENYRNQGIGSRLLNQLLLILKNQVYIYDLSNTLFFIKNGFINYHKYLLYSYTIKEQFHTYKDFSDFIALQKNRVYSLENYKKMMNDLFNPQYLLKTIHIGGTNGKGSTTNYIKTILKDASYKVGMFTTPALSSRLEIMRINDVIISEDEIVMYANKYIELWLKYEISMYEIEVFIAIIYFLHHQVDFALFEVGLGGEFDATNIINPIISAITNIGLDHKEYLGDTYEKIAKTKAGIIKPSIPFVTMETKKECLDIFESILKNNSSYMIKVDQINDLKLIDHQVHFKYKNICFILNTSALYQAYNSVLTYEIIQYLNYHHYIQIELDHILNSLKNASWKGRFETISIKPHIIIDGAHNREGIDAFIETAKHFNNKKIIFSALKDKDSDYMISRLLSICDDLTICDFDFYRAQDASVLAKNYPVKVVNDFKEAINELKDFEGTVFVTGSLYFIAQVREYILKQ